MPVTFHTADIKFTLKQKSKLKQFITSQLRYCLPVRQAGNIPAFQLSFVFTSDEYLCTINKKFLNHDYYTDIITFPLSENEQELAGEIYISIDRVMENAEKFNVQKTKIKESRLKQVKSNSAIRNPQFETELHRVIFHGVLHLLGYKDKTTAQKAEMRKMEDKWLKSYKLLASS